MRNPGPRSNQQVQLMCVPNVHRSESQSRQKLRSLFQRNKLRELAETRVFPTVASLAKRCAFLICCLACCLAFSEFPETLNLSDDSSNDFIVVNEPRAIGSSETAVVSQEATHPMTQPAFSFNIDLFRQEFLPAHDLLSLMSFRRI